MTSITVRAPMRLTICGGGNDLPVHWRGRCGFMITAAIDKYVTVNVRPYDYPTRRAPYVLAAGWTEYDEVVIRSDIAPGSGLGGSSALMVALLKARYPDTPFHELAMAAYNIERYTLGQPVGYQDAFAAAYGGVIRLQIDSVGRVSVSDIDLPDGFADRLVLMHTGSQRSAGKVLSEQTANVSTRLVCRDAMEQIANVAHDISDDLRFNDGRRFGELTELHWTYKRATCDAVSTPQIDAWHDLAIAEGAIGFKCCGAGGGGYLLLVTEPEKHNHLVATMTEAGLVEMPFKFVDTGAEVLHDPS